MADHLSHREEGRRGINFISVESIAELEFSQVHAFNFIAHLMHCQQMFYVSINVLLNTSAVQTTTINVQCRQPQ